MVDVVSEMVTDEMATVRDIGYNFTEGWTIERCVPG